MELYKKTDHCYLLLKAANITKKPIPVSQSKLLLLKTLSKSLRYNNWYQHRWKLITLWPSVFFPLQNVNLVFSRGLNINLQILLCALYETKFC